jgi:hypothetical protein
VEKKKQRRTPQSLPHRKFWLDNQDRERILGYVRPKFLAAIRGAGIPLHHQETGPPENALAVDQPREIQGRVSDESEVSPDDSPMKGDTIFGHPSVTFSLGPLYSTFVKERKKILVKRKNKVSLRESGKPVLREIPFRIEIPPRNVPKDRTKVKRFLERAEKNLESLGFDESFRMAYRDNAEVAFKRYFLARTRSKNEGKLLDDLQSILGNIQGDRLWAILLSDPETGEVDEMARHDLKQRIASCKAIEEPLSIPHNAQGLIIREFCKERDLLPPERIGGRIRTRRRRKT